ncbi:hypothetical protein Clacol_008170 [Clathrus columnatus]|uniref:Uncharacterized protein n=1 Tax=Clathrus columnatus TaxID=1419009 RepID=A0AAV5ALE4_9AGAM|nr:hypothetical protein Clacol_008170 [Clathrus columnatus]
MVAHVENKQHSRERPNTVSSRFNRVVHSLLPRLLPVIACLLCVPLLLTISGAAGWVVWKRIPVGWNEEVYLQYGDSTNPYAEVELPYILYGQPYDISLYLVLPTTESNYALGNFMASLRLSNPRNETLAAIRRPAVLIQKRPSFIRNLMMSPPSVAGMHVPLLSGWVAGTTNVKAYIELGRSDAWKSLGNGGTRELSVVQATLNGIVRPTGIRCALYFDCHDGITKRLRSSLFSRYPRLTTFVSSFVFFFVSIIVVTGVIFSTLGWSASRRRVLLLSEQENDSDLDKYDNMDSTNEKDEDDKSKFSNSQEPQDAPAGFHSGNIRRRALKLHNSEDFPPESLKRTSGVKVEEDTGSHMHSASSTMYPKSPYPGFDIQEEVVSSGSDLQDSKPVVPS